MCSTNRIMTNHLVFGGLLLSSITGKSSYVIQMHHTIAILPKNEQKYTYSKMIQKLCTFKLKWEKSFSHRYLAGLTGFYSRCINDNHSINQSTYLRYIAIPSKQYICISFEWSLFEMHGNDFLQAKKYQELRT